MGISLACLVLLIDLVDMTTLSSLYYTLTHKHAVIWYVIIVNVSTKYCNYVEEDHLRGTNYRYSISHMRMVGYRIAT